MTARDKAFQALHNLSGAKWLPLEALVRRLRKFGFSDRWASDTAQEWYREFGRGSKTVDAPAATSSIGAPPLECTCEEERSKSCPIHGFCPECGDFIEDGPCSCAALCFCGREVQEAGDFCSQACRSQALEETK